MTPTITVLPHAIDRYIERVLRSSPPRPRCDDLDAEITSAIRMAIVRPDARLSRPMWRAPSWQRIVTVGRVRYVVRGGLVVTVLGERASEG